jgi:hypothetical protein
MWYISITKMTENTRSLYSVTKRIVEILQNADGPICLKDLAHITCKRRCYDVILVLAAIGKVERVGKNTVLWQRDHIASSDSDESDDFDNILSQLSFEQIYK